MVSERGLFLSFEGPDGAGKTTQIGRLLSTLSGLGFSAIRTREPGGDPVGEAVRAILLHREMTAQAEFLLFAAARAQNVSSIVKPALDSGKIVLCDRFTDSSRAYQGAGRGLPDDLIAAVNDFATANLSPHKTFLLDIDPARGLLRRVHDENNRLDREALDFHRRVRDGFLARAAAEPERIVVIDADRDPDTVASDLWTHIEPFLAGADIARGFAFGPMG